MQREGLVDSAIRSANYFYMKRKLNAVMNSLQNIDGTPNPADHFENISYEDLTVKFLECQKAIKNAN